MRAALVPILFPRVQNLILQSETFDNASWVLSSGSITANQIAAPNGTTTADLLTIGSGAVVRQVPTLSDGTHIMAVRLKKGTVNFGFLQMRTGASAFKHWFNLNTGVVGVKDVGGGQHSIKSLGDDWCLCSVIFTFAAGSGPLFDIGSSSADNGTDGGAIYGWGAQLNRGAVLSRYRATTTTIIA